MQEDLNRGGSRRSAAGVWGLLIVLAGITVLAVLTAHFVRPRAWLDGLAPRHLVLAGALIAGGLLISGAAVLRGRTLAGRGGVMLGMLGIMSLATLIAFYLADDMGLLVDPELDLAARNEQTQRVLREATIKVESHLQQAGVLPSLAESRRLVGNLRDGWHEPVVYLLHEDGTFEVFSAGPDQEVGTSDDVMMERMD
jgi:hypothetical protein